MAASSTAADTAESVSLNSAALSRLINASLGAEGEFNCSEDAKAVIRDCCKELVQLLASEANEMCLKENKSTTITPKHLTKALEELEYSHWLPEVNQAARDESSEGGGELGDDGAPGAKAPSRRTQAKRKLASSGKTIEQLAAEQKAKFARARATMDHQVQQHMATATMAHIAMNGLLDDDEPPTKQSKLEPMPTPPMTNPGAL